MWCRCGLERETQPRCLELRKLLEIPEIPKITGTTKFKIRKYLMVVAEEGIEIKSVLVGGVVCLLEI